ncbi:NAD-dependent epimerase/dehydratase family protein [Heyndrickxia vini]|uniref:NAD-dependent epimerase/dehydratase family protein n=1 Tax=Heyndrickxia vini TaxID=1476025 RepID=A0ABX7E9Y2_9BACI|nr:NAD-dependent epimerase/dehydratase family protein [Heyndrickxia vini]QQZ11287.1 NAD-dependent epimerase/dehydratase family protein [Heyndrickxia vini]
MKTALVLGGTRFFGVKLVQALLSNGVKVTVATRGNSTSSFQGQVESIQFDRNQLESFQSAFNGREWDVVFDQICYSSIDAMNAIQVFQGKTKKYIFTSTLSVYDLLDKELVESDFDPYSYTIELKDKDEVTYQEGKRQAEAVFFQKAPFPVTAVRFPIVLGENDYTQRMTYYINKVIQEEVIYLRNLDASMGFINEDEAGEFLYWIGSYDFQGPINTCTNGTVTLKEFIKYIEEATGKEAKVEISSDEDNQTPYSIPRSWTMSNQKAIDLGFEFQDIHQWLPHLIQTVLKK